jgi:hypothetical protein
VGVSYTWGLFAPPTKVEGEHTAQLKHIENLVGELVFHSGKLSKDEWKEVTITAFPQDASYILLLFSCKQGFIIGRVRVKGSEDVSSFSTTVNDTIPVAVRNLWVSAEGRYKIPTIIEFSVHEKPTPNASLSVYTKGFLLDLHGIEHHPP